MLGSKYTIRKATLKDLDKIIDLHLASFSSEEHIPVLIGKRYVRATYQWILTHENGFVLIAQDGDNIIGLQSVCIGSYELPMFLSCLPDLIISLITNYRLFLSKRLWKRLLRVFSKLKIKRNGTMEKYANFIIGIIDSQYRGKGIFSVIVNSAVQICKENGCKKIYTGIYKQNITTQQIFTRYGWIICPELETRETCFYQIDL